MTTYTRRTAIAIFSLIALCITLGFGATYVADADTAAADTATIYTTAPAIFQPDNGGSRPMEMPAIQLAPPIAAYLNHCDNDTSPLWIDVATGALYGDQDGNGFIDGEECNWS